MLLFWPAGFGLRKDFLCENYDCTCLFRHIRGEFEVHDPAKNRYLAVPRLDLPKTGLEDEQIQLISSFSGKIDVDLVQAISELAARQIAMQASLHVTANILQLTLLDYI